jgi:hypothetical protein
VGAEDAEEPADNFALPREELPSYWKGQRVTLTSLLLLLTVKTRYVLFRLVILAEIHPPLIRSRRPFLVELSPNRCSLGLKKPGRI